MSTIQAIQGQFVLRKTHPNTLSLGLICPFLGPSVTDLTKCQRIQQDDDLDNDNDDF